MRAYRYYRFLFISAIWTCVNEIGVYASNDGTGTNLLTGSTATASGAYSGQPASYAIDGNTGTAWGSASSAANNWLSFDIGTPAAISSFKISANLSGWYAPRNLTVQASNDGVTWATFVTCPNFNVAASDTLTDAVQRIYRVSGESLLDTTSESSLVFVFHWATGVLISSIVPASDGTYEVVMSTNTYVLVTHIGPAGYQPISDGPITPY